MVSPRPAASASRSMDWSVALMAASGLPISCATMAQARPTWERRSSASRSARARSIPVGSAGRAEIGVTRSVDEAAGSSSSSTSSASHRYRPSPRRTHTSPESAVIGRR